MSEVNWKEICAKCADGEIEPTFCEYYGEPNGCNSPTYQEHPPVGNAAAMRSALVTILAEMEELSGIAVGRRAYFSPYQIAEKCRFALAGAPRNCDKYASYKEAYEAWNKSLTFPQPIARFGIWLMDEAKGGVE